MTWEYAFGPDDIPIDRYSARDRCRGLPALSVRIFCVRDTSRGLNISVQHGRTCFIKLTVIYNYAYRLYKILKHRNRHHYRYLNILKTGTNIL